MSFRLNMISYATVKKISIQIDILRSTSKFEFNNFWKRCKTILELENQFLSFVL